MTPQHAAPPPYPLWERFCRCLYASYCWVFFGLILIAFGLPIVFWPGTRAHRRSVARAGARALFWVARMPLETTGMEHLPKRNHVLVANHASFLDALILTAALPASPGYAFVARQEFRSQILLWPLLRAMGTVILHEHTASTPSNIERLTAALQDAQNLVVFPEGGIHRSPGLRPLHTGAFIAAGELGVPVVPAGIEGARQALRLKTWQPIRTRITVRIGDVIEPAGTDEAAVQGVMSTARERMAALAGEALFPGVLREP